MAWVVLFASVPLWLMLGAVAAKQWSLRRFRASPGTFRCKLRLQSGEFPGLRSRWSLTTWDGLWLHDALLVVRGILRLHIVALPVRFVDGPLAPLSPKDVHGLGRQPVALTMSLDEGAVALLAAPGHARSLVAGPYVVAELTGTPGRGRRERPPTGC